MAGVGWRQLGYTGSERDHNWGQLEPCWDNGLIRNEHADSTWDILGVRARVMVWFGATYMCAYIFISIHSCPALCPLHFCRGVLQGQTLLQFHKLSCVLFRIEPLVAAPVSDIKRKRKIIQKEQKFESCSNGESSNWKRRRNYLAHVDQPVTFIGNIGNSLSRL